ncbi:hypothetical protein PybrP1_005560 [[Pythium] brassicae (nom. inval.)]|nr:hypothetical protein PybrP1_005560 [[Pythium] brassicae (nom. inval.)]
MKLLLLTTGESVALVSALALALFAAPLLRATGDDQWEFISLYDDYTNFEVNPVLLPSSAAAASCAGAPSSCAHDASNASTSLFSWHNLYAMATMRRINVYEPLSWLLKAAIVHFVGMDATLLYLVHPMHVEVVAWPSAQPYALAALFANLSLASYLQKKKSALQSARGNRSRTPAYEQAQHAVDEACESAGLDWLVAAFFLCCVLSKSVAVLLPVAFFLVDVLVVYRINTSGSGFTMRAALKSTRRKAPVLVIFLAFIVITLWSNGESWEDMITLSLPERALKAAMAPAWTLRHLLWPARLRMHYQLREADLDLFGNMDALLSIAALVLWVLAGVWRWRQQRSPVAFLATAYFCAMLLPTSGLVQHGIVTQGCDRYAYFPSTIFVPLLGYAFGRALVGVSYGAVLCASVLLSKAQMETWRNERTLYEHSIRLDPTDWRMYSWLAKTLASASPPVCAAEPQKCQQLWRLARTFAPTRSLTGVLFRTKVLVPLGEFDLACSVYEQLLLMHPDSPAVLNNIGVCRLLRGAVTLSGARELFARAVDAADTGKYAQGSVAHTLENFEAWVAAFREEHGDREPTNQERLTFSDWVMV